MERWTSAPMAHGGAPPQLLLLRGEEEERGGGRRQNGVEGLGARGGVPPGVGEPAAARPTPAYGRHVAVVGWGKAGAARGRERGGGCRPRCWLG